MSKYINVLMADGESMQLIADMDINVVGQDGNDEDFIHLADVLYGAVLQRTRGQDKAVLKPGKYTVRLMVTIVGEPDEVSQS